jgi:poly(3-hydroxybutyrate) depolymerase
MIMRTRPTHVALVVMAVSAAAASAQPLARGQAIDVTTLADAAHSYVLYLPNSYSADRRWPILIGFHPGARGRAIVETYREAAERYGVIVAGSNNSRNGPWEVSLGAARVMLEDLGRRLAIDERRVYLTGHSGGARLAMHIALSTTRIAGVIASSAGAPGAERRSSLPFPLFGTAGIEDFNYLEMRQVTRPLKTPHRLAVFDGGHTLPPAPVAMQAIEWLELQAMASGRRATDVTVVDRWWTAREAEVTAAGETTTAVHLLRELADDFRPWRDVRPFEARAADLARRRDIARALERERDDEEKESRDVQALGRHVAGLGSLARAESLRDLQRLLSRLRDEATDEGDGQTRARARRLLRAALVTGGRGADAEYAALLRRYAGVP